MLSRKVRGVAWLATCVIFAGRQPCVAAGWRPVTDEDFAATAPAGDPDAGAIVLLREMTFDDTDLDGSEVRYYIRIKVLNAAGVEALNKTEIPYLRRQRPREVAARVIHPDGSISEVGRRQFFNREVVRQGRESISVTAFSFPALEPGCIAEYRYRLLIHDPIGGMSFFLSDDFPVAKVRFRVRPFSYPGLLLKTLWTRDAAIEQLGRDRDNFFVYEAHDVPVEKSEPFPPPETITRRWFLFYYVFDDAKPDTYWSHVADGLNDMARKHLAPKKELRRAAGEIVAGAANEGEKLQRLYDFCRKRIRNVSYDSSGYSPEEVDELDANRSPRDTLKHGYGTDTDINLLFGALAHSLGFEVHLAYCADRSENIFQRNLTTSSALPDLIVAMQRSGQWRYFDPGALYVPFGHLRWYNEGAAVLVAQGRKWDILETPTSPLQYSITKRTAQLELTPDGAIEGDVMTEITGHDADTAKRLHDGRTREESLELIRDRLQDRLGPVEISEFVVGHATDPDEPVAISYHIRVPTYAEVTGDRIFLQPAFFHKGAPAVFASAERRFDVYFPYPCEQRDEVTIQLPQGYYLEEPSSPRGLSAEDAILFTTHLRYAPKSNRLISERTFDRQIMHVPVKGYPVLKSCYDHIHRQNEHTITLHHLDEPPPTESTAAPPAPKSETAGSSPSA